MNPERPAIEKDAEAARFAERFLCLRQEISKVIVGQEEVIEGVLVCLLAGGHALLEGVPGLGKTLLVRTLAQALELRFSRIQFTPDLMPADIVGTNIVMEDPAGGRFFKFQSGPVFANIVLADEVNRATPKTQSALLEAMQERSVTVAGTIHRLTEPFLVMATQNPIEMEGTYPLPEAQLDRFFYKILVASPTLSELSAIIDRTTGTQSPEVETVLLGAEVLGMQRRAREVAIGGQVKEFALRMVLGTHPDSEYAPDTVHRFVRFGSSPRGAQALILAGKIYALLDGRHHVSEVDLRRAALPALRHRIILNIEGEAEGVRPDRIVQEVTRYVWEQIEAEAHARAGV
ncbi:MAG: AAA family ATPase [Armatimonadetes bacterium]|nr:AAA family ATPase [Armatimonadota bacterium]